MFNIGSRSSLYHTSITVVKNSTISDSEPFFPGKIKPVLHTMREIIIERNVSITNTNVRYAISERKHIQKVWCGICRGRIKWVAPINLP